MHSSFEFFESLNMNELREIWLCDETDNFVLFCILLTFILFHLNLLILVCTFSMLNFNRENLTSNSNHSKGEKSSMWGAKVNRKIFICLLLIV